MFIITFHSFFTWFKINIKSDFQIIIFCPKLVKFWIQCTVVNNFQYHLLCVRSYRYIDVFNRGRILHHNELPNATLKVQCATLNEVSCEMLKCEDM